MKIGNKEFKDNNKTYVMGILNVTPDSFSDGGKYNQLDAALFHVKEMIKDGADLLDIGGESTRPGYEKISDQEEIERVVPIIEAIRSSFEITISIDTYKSKVAAAAIDAGADLVNDIWGLKYDAQMAETIAKRNAACCLMHNRKGADYTAFLTDVVSDLEESVKLAKAAGIADDKIMLDPGVGFAKDYEQNLSIINHMECILKLGYPALLGTSRKSVIAKALNLPVEQRVEGTIATSVMAVMKGYSYVRVHDVKENKRAIQMTEAVIYS